MNPRERDESFVCPHLHGTIRRGDVGAEHARDARVEHVQLATIVPKPSARRRGPLLCLGCGGPILEPRVYRRDRLLDLRRRVCGPACALAASEYKRRMQANQLPEWA